MRGALLRSPLPARSLTAGELWGEELLRELRAARFAPAAWITFWRDSFERARLRRKQLRRQHRQALVLAGTGFLGWLAVALVGRPGLAAVGAGWWLLVVLMLDWHIGMLERPDGRPLSGIGVANVLSLLRVAVVPLLAAVPATAVAAILIAAGASDALDGWLARRLDQVSRLGHWLDGAVDSLVLAVAAVALARSQLLPLWVGPVVVARCFAPWFVVALAYFLRAETPSRESVVPGRLPGVVLISGLVLAALHVPAATLVVGIGVGGGIATFALTVARALASHRHRSEPRADLGISSLGTSVHPGGNS